MRVLVCGSRACGRNYNTAIQEAVYRHLDALAPSLVIHGGCDGVDQLAGHWSDSRGVPCMQFNPAWAAFGKSAGPTRNAWMLKFGEPDLVLAFPGGAGTEDMIARAEEAGVEVRRVS